IKLCRGRRSEAYHCHEKWREISCCFSDFWLPHSLLTANLCDNPANLCGNHPFLGSDRLHDGAVIVLYGSFFKPCGAPREAACGLWKAKRQIFHGKVANLSGKAQLRMRGYISAMV